MEAVRFHQSAAGDGQPGLEGFFDDSLVRLHCCLCAAVQFGKFFRLCCDGDALGFPDADCVGVAGYFLEAVAAERKGVVLFQPCKT